MPLADLPARGERSAPTFDNSQPEELERYFADLGLLLDHFRVTNEQERKQAALKYLKTRTGHLWKTADAWIDNTKTYNDFKAEIAGLYPGASGDRTHTIRDLDVLTGHSARTRILSTADLGEGHRQFLLISRYLIDKGCLSTHEQSRAFFRGMQPDLEARVRQRLQRKFIDHFPDDPYALPDVYEAASYVLRGTTTASTALALPQQAPNPSTPDRTSTQLEALAVAIASLGEVFKAGLLPGIAAAATSKPGSSVCSFCSGAGHFIRECEAVEEYTRAGKCKRNTNGKVVLPHGEMVSRDAQGTWLRDRIDEWHRQNPGRMAGQLFFVAATTRAATVPPSNAAVPERAYARNQPPHFQPEVFSTQQPHRNDHAGQDERVDSTSNRAEVPRTQQKDMPPHMAQDASAERSPGQGVPQEPARPYAAEATHGANPMPTPVAEEVYKRAMETPITVTQRELLSLAPEVRAQAAEESEPGERLAQTIADETAEDNEELNRRERREARLEHISVAYAATALGLTRVPTFDIPSRRRVFLS